jgi:HK97 family phage portal protein
VSLIGSLINAGRLPQAASWTAGAPRGFSWGGGQGKARELAAYEAVSTLYGVVSTLAQSTGMLSWNLYRKAASGDPADRRIVTTHPALTVLREPSRFYTTGLLFESGQQHVDLAGVSYILVVRELGVITELWPIRPDRISPVKHPTEFITGWVYRSPDGVEVDLDVDDILWNRSPDPRDPYNGRSPVASLLADLEGDAAAAAWNANFFKNDATPGGIIEVDQRLSDDDFRTARRRWAEQHQGVSNSHRVAILEWGKWKDVSYSQKDMDLTALRSLSKENIREAYGFPSFMTGTVTDVNRANAEASEVMYGRWKVIPRADRWREVLNSQFLPMFGGNYKLYEFDYGSPVPDSAEDEDRGRDSKVKAYVALLGAGVDPNDAAEVCGLPTMSVREGVTEDGPGQAGGAGREREDDDEGAAAQ